MNRKQEIQILIPQLEKQYSEAHDIAIVKHEQQIKSIKNYFSHILKMGVSEFDLHFNENQTTLNFKVDGNRSGDLKIYHPTTYSTIENNPYRLSWYSTNACDVNNPHHVVYLVALGRVAENFNGKGDIFNVLDAQINNFKNIFEEQREIGLNLNKLRSELQEIERVEKFQSVYDNGGIRGEFNVYGKIEKGRTIGCVSLAVDKVTDKTVTVTFRTEFYGEVTKRLKKREADSLFVSIVDALSQKEEA
jgi:hypothetical protein